MDVSQISSVSFKEFGNYNITSTLGVLEQTVELEGIVIMCYQGARREKLTNIYEFVQNAPTFWKKDALGLCNLFYI